jgi:hypothetical protein
MFEIATLKAALPNATAELTDMMVNEALCMYEESGLTLDDLMPTAAMVIELPGEKRQIKISLSLEWADNDYRLRFDRTHGSDDDPLSMT